ncbi:MAG TPA: helix-turn-helix transcriptional regulator [Chthoniobacteraceae bacterium]|nr:helix-turn-helix transcriptional regulator [Chthoniobacteraceae bacterium]
MSLHDDYSEHAAKRRLPQGIAPARPDSECIRESLAQECCRFSRNCGGFVERNAEIRRLLRESTAPRSFAFESVHEIEPRNRLARIDRGWKQAELAQMLGTVYQTVEKWEHNLVAKSHNSMTLPEHTDKVLLSRRN